MARPGQARRDLARQAGRGPAGHGGAWRGAAWHGWAWHGRQRMERSDEARRGMAGYGMVRQAGRGHVWRGMARNGKADEAWPGGAWLGRRGEAGQARFFHGGFSMKRKRGSRQHATCSPSDIEKWSTHLDHIAEGLESIARKMRVVELTLAINSALKPTKKKLAKRVRCSSVAKLARAPK